MNKAIGITLAAVIALIGIGFGGRTYATRAMSNRAVTPKPLGSSTPAAVGLPFSRVAVEAGDRTLIGWWVRARADSGRVPPAVLFLHGNRSSMSDYIDLQKFLYRQGISSMVFDYSGFGASGGSASLKNAIVDAGNVARVFEDSAGKAARKVAMGSAMGSTVLLQAIDSVQPHVSGIVIEGVDASARGSAVRSGRIPKLVAPLVVDVADNVAAASRVRVPMLVVHSVADNRVPMADAERVLAAVPSQASLVRHWRKGHSALLASSKPCDWAPVLAFVKSGALPKGRVDSVDACMLEARLAAEKAAAAANAVAQASGGPRGQPTQAGSTKAGIRKPGATKAPATKVTDKKAVPTKSPLPAKRP